MKKKVFGRKLSRERDSRRALFRSLTRALVKYGKIETTKGKAKAVRPFIEKLFLTAQKGDISARRRIYTQLGNDRKTTDSLIKQSGDFKRKSGFTRVINLPARRGDAAEMVRLEWVEQPTTSDKKQATGKKRVSKTDKKTQGKKNVKSKK